MYQIRIGKLVLKTATSARITIRSANGSKVRTSSARGTTLVWNTDFQLPISSTYQIYMKSTRSSSGTDPIIITPSVLSFSSARDHDYPVIGGTLTIRHGTVLPAPLRTTPQTTPQTTPRALVPGSVPYAPGPDPTEIQALEQETEQVQSQCQSSLNRSLRMVTEMREMGSATIQALHDQGQDIEDMREHVARIEHDTIRSNRKLRSIESSWGTLANKLLPSSKVKVPVSVTVSRETTGRVKSQPTGVLFPREDRTAVQEELEVQTNELWSALDDLKSMALTMNQEVTVQVENTVALNREMIHAEEKMKKTGTRVKKLC